MSSKIVAAVPYQRGHSDSRSKSKSDKRPSGIIDAQITKTALMNEPQIFGSKALLGNFGVSNTLSGINSRPLGIASLSSNNLVQKPNDFQRRVSSSPYSFKAKHGQPMNVSNSDFKSFQLLLNQANMEKAQTVFGNAKED